MPWFGKTRPRSKTEPPSPASHEVGLGIGPGKFAQEKPGSTTARDLASSTMSDDRDLNPDLSLRHETGSSCDMMRNELQQLKLGIQLSALQLTMNQQDALIPVVDLRQEGLNHYGQLLLLGNQFQKGTKARG